MEEGEEEEEEGDLSYQDGKEGKKAAHENADCVFSCACVCFAPPPLRQYSERSRSFIRESRVRDTLFSPAIESDASFSA